MKNVCGKKETGAVFIQSGLYTFTLLEGFPTPSDLAIKLLPIHSRSAAKSKKQNLKVSTTKDCKLTLHSRTIIAIICGSSVFSEETMTSLENCHII